MSEVEQYLHGTDKLWMAYYRSSPEKGDMNGISRKFSGTLEEAAVEAQRFAEETGNILQCLRRRF